MFQVDSYVYIPRKDKALGLPVKIHVRDRDLLLKVASDLDLNHLDGHIELSYNEMPILTEQFWDEHLDYTWRMFLEAIERFVETGAGSFHSWEFGIHCSMKEIRSGLILFIVGERAKHGAWYLPKREFVLAVLDGATEFFQCFWETFKWFKGEYQDCLKLKERLQRLL